MASNEFNGREYVQSVARQLVVEFQEAGKAGHPVLIGTARETPARVKFVKLLPGNIAVGSGIVMDSFGGKSKQQDIVIYERDICPVFSINDTPEATFYPVESVVAVGEVKSTLDKATIADSFAKIASVKALKRIVETESNVLGLPATVPFRSYGERRSMQGVEEEQYSPVRSLDQVFGFVLAGDFGLKSDTAFEHAVTEASGRSADQAPNVIVSLANGHISWLKAENNSLCRSAMEGDVLVYSDSAGQAFPWLIHLLKIYIDHGRTVDAKHLRRYTSESDGIGHPITLNRIITRK